MTPDDVYASLRSLYGSLRVLYKGELNDEITRGNFTDRFKQMLHALKDDGVITSYFVQCDHSNNTPVTINQGELHLLVKFKHRDFNTEYHYTTS